jgi:hypothetical protein
VTLQIDGVELTLKLGRKKDRSLSRSDNPIFGNYRIHDYLSPAHSVAPWAVPVADSRKPVKTDEGDALVSEQVSRPAPEQITELPNA